LYIPTLNSENQNSNIFFLLKENMGVNMFGKLLRSYALRTHMIIYVYKHNSAPSTTGRFTTIVYIILCENVVPEPRWLYILYNIIYCVTYHILMRYREIAINPEEVK